MFTVSPDEPAGQVPIGGWSSANAMRGSIAAPARPADPANTARRLRRKSCEMLISSSQAVDRQRRPQTFLAGSRAIGRAPYAFCEALEPADLASSCQLLRKSRVEKPDRCLT